ncbi:MAG TPA: serine hydrolase domain-containing protein, partial [Fimbriimonadaceae bacterium]|nr:serine hydrolase domain-containing protein [Fimbriimonadaceae bacterium]
MKVLLLIPLFFLAALAHADKVDDLVERAMKAKHIPGLVLAVLRDGKPVKMKAYGLANVEYDVPARTDTPFLLASMTKSFTAACIMMLVEEGKIKLDAPISTYLDDTPEAWKGITVRNLLSHTGGLKDRFEEVPFDVNKWKINYSKEAMYDAARKTAPDFKPGEHFQYSDQDFFLLGIIIEKVGDMSYTGYLKKYIFDPLGMKDSGTIRLSRIVKGMAAGYAWQNGELFHNSRRTDYGMASHFGMISTVEDLAKWDTALYGEKLLKRSSLDAMWTLSKLNNGSAAYTSYGGYGLGWFLDEFNGHRSVGHGGSTGTAYLRFPEDKLSVIVLTNLEQITGGDAPGIALAIAKTYLPDLEWSALKPKEKFDAALLKTFRSALEGMAAGKFDADLYTPLFGSMLQPTIPAQKVGLGPLGPIRKIEVLEELPWGEGHLVRNRITF